MTNRLRRRFWSESGLGAITALLAVITLIKRDWIEAMFGVDPDGHNGSVEWLIVGGLLLATLSLAALASYEWRRAATAVA